MALFGLFGAFVVFAISQTLVVLAVSDADDRPSMFPVLLLVMLEAGGVGPSAWLRGLIDAVSWVL